MRPAGDQPGDGSDPGRRGEENQQDPDDLGEVSNTGVLRLDCVDHSPDGHGKWNDHEQYITHPDLLAWLPDLA